MPRNQKLYVLSDRLNSGQIAFIFRVAIQILSYGGIFLLGLIILGNTPRSASLKTHDTLNRVVGKSTATSTTVRWIQGRLFGKNRDPTPSTQLLIAFILSLLYGLFIALSDVGFLGLRACSVPFAPYTDFPASIHSEAEARAFNSKIILEGADPSQIKSLRCNSAKTVNITFYQGEVVEEGNGSLTLTNGTVLSCTSWDNSTYDEPSSFRSINLTDTEALTSQMLGPAHSEVPDEDNIQAYYFGPLGKTQVEARISSGIAVIPHSTGATMLIGAPNLNRSQSVALPKTMAVEVSIGCLPLGLVGIDYPTSTDLFAFTDYFIPDDKYKPFLRTNFTGPDFLFEPLLATAGQLRQAALQSQWYNTSNVGPNGYFTSHTWGAAGSYSLDTSVHTWLPDYFEQIEGVKQQCTDTVQSALNVTAPPPTVWQDHRRACEGIVLSGSSLENGEVVSRYSVMICASTTSFEMVSATLQTDEEGTVTATTNAIRSDLHEIRADFYGSYSNRRFTLSDNPSGQSKHHISQDYATVLSDYGLAIGGASAGFTIAQIGSAILDPSADDYRDPSIVNATYYSCDNYSSEHVTRWGGQLAASYFLSSYALNGFVAMSQETLTVRSLGGKSAVCYQAPYLVAFAPLLVAAVVIILWSLYMLVTLRFRDVKGWEKRYGGLGPTLSKYSPEDVLVWDEDGEFSQLRPERSNTSTPSIPSEIVALVPDKAAESG